MARGRMLSKSLSTSRRFADLFRVAGTLAEFCQSLFPLINSHADDFGRLPGDAFTVKFLALPTSPRTVDEFETAIGYLHTVGLIQLYDAAGEKVIQINKFDENQTGLHKRTQSKFPKPPDASGKVPEFPGQEKRTEEKGREEKRTERTAADAALPARFDRFWSAYPNKVKKPNALKAFTKINPDDALTDAIIAGVERYKTTRKWLDDGGEFIPHPATFLNARQWEDQQPAVVRQQETDAAREQARTARDHRRAEHQRREDAIAEAVTDILGLLSADKLAQLRHDATASARQMSVYQRMPQAARDECIAGLMRRLVADRCPGPALFELRDKMRAARAKGAA